MVWTSTEEQGKKSNSDSNLCKNHPGSASAHRASPVSALGLSNSRTDPLRQGHKPKRGGDEVAAAVIPTNPSCQGPFPDGKAPLPPLSIRAQVAALSQSSEAARLPFPPSPTGIRCLCNTPAIDFSPGRLLRPWNFQNMQVGRILAGFYLGKESFSSARGTVHQNIPVQAFVLFGVSCCYGDVSHTSFQLGLQEKSSSLGAESTKRAAPTRFPDQYLQEGGSTPGSSF